MRVSKTTSERARSWNVARRQSTKGDFGVYERSIFFYVARRELAKVVFTVSEVYTFLSWYYNRYYNENIYFASRCLYKISRYA